MARLKPKNRLSRIALEAQTKSFADIAGPGLEVDGAELDRLVEDAKTRHYLRKRRKPKP